MSKVIADEYQDAKLVQACENNDVGAAIEALRNGASPNADLSVPESSALSFACANKNPRLVSLLLRRRES